MEPTPYCHLVEQAIEDVPVPDYCDEEHGTWQLLHDKQLSLIDNLACAEFTEGVRKLQFDRERIPALKDVSSILQKTTGWQLLRVEGLVHPKDFFSLLARKRFPSTDFIRKREDLDYTPAPDMFHDLFGHTPLLTNPEFTAFFEAFGKIGVNACERYPESHPIHDMVQRVYWFTVEFGVINTPRGVRAYGSGSTSSPQELAFCLSPQCRRHPFEIDKVAEQTFDIWHLQEDVFVIDSFTQLDRDVKAWAARHQIL